MNFLHHKLSKQQAWQWVAFSVIAAVVLVVYSPSLMHVIRADQLTYLAELGNKTSFWDLTLGSIDINRHTLFCPGDEILYRPVLFVLLGSEKYFFGNNFMYWQAVGIALHLLVVWLLLRLLLTIALGWAAVWATAFFALLLCNLEMVIWHHINGYMIFVATTLMLLICLAEFLKGKKPTPQDTWFIFWVALIGCFSHEVGNAASFVLGCVFVMILKPYKGIWKALFIAPLVYLLASFISALVHPFSMPGHHNFHLIKIIGDVLYFMGSWFYVGVFPYEVPWALKARVMLAENDTFVMHPFLITHFASCVSIILIGMLVLFVLRYSKPFKANHFYSIGIVALMVVGVNALTIAVGRGGLFAVRELVRVNTYYMYIFWVFCVAGIFVLVDWKKIHQYLKWAMAIVLSVFIIFNAVRIYAFNEQQVRENNPVVVLVKTLELLIKTHGHEKDFSFYVAPTYPGNYIDKELRRIDEPETRKYSLVEILYPQYFTTHHAKYNFLLK